MTGEEKEFETIERGRRRSSWACSWGRPSLTGALSLQMTATSTPSRRPSPSSSSLQSAGRPSPTPGEAGSGGAGGRQVAGLHPDPGSCRIELEEWEHVTCMKTVSLRSEETVSGLKGYVAAGTCLMQGEEVTCRGRVSSQRARTRVPAAPVRSLMSPPPSLHADPDHGRDRGGARAWPAPDQEQVQGPVREGAEGARDRPVPLQRPPGVGHRPEGGSLSLWPVPTHSPACLRATGCHLSPHRSSCGACVPAS